MSVARGQPLIAAAALVLLAACGRASPAPPVRTANEAADIAQRALRSAHLDEEIVGAERQDGAWLVTTRWRETSMAGHLVTVDAASGKVTMERYRTLQLGRRKAGSRDGKADGPNSSAPQLRRRRLDERAGDR